MTDEDQSVQDSPVGWVAKHIRAYVASDGRQGHEKWGMKNLLLTTRGRRTGALRRTALFYERDDGRYVVIASAGGGPKHPVWYLNLLAHPEAHVQVGAEKFRARATVATGEERERLWRLLADGWPTYDTYRKRAKREIPVVVLEPVA